VSYLRKFSVKSGVVYSTGGTLPSGKAIHGKLAKLGEAVPNNKPQAPSHTLKIEAPLGVFVL